MRENSVDFLSDRIRTESRLALHTALHPAPTVSMTQVRTEGRRVMEVVAQEWKAAGLTQFWPALGLQTHTSVRSFPRILGFGYWQMAGLAKIVGGAGTPIIDLGARFNQAICTFDRLSDRCEFRNELKNVFNPRKLSSRYLHQVAHVSERSVSTRQLACLIAPIFAYIEKHLTICK